MSGPVAFSPRRSGWTKSDSVALDIKSLTLEDLQAQFKLWGACVIEPGNYWSWLYERRVTSWEAMSNLPKPLSSIARAV